MALVPGTFADIDAAGSMANAIKEAFEKIWPSAMGPLPLNTSKEMKMLFAAVAEGVVKHLAAHPEAFVITVTGSGFQDLKATIEIKR